MQDDVPYRRVAGIGMLELDHEYLAYEDFEAIAWNGDRWEPARETATRDPLRDVAWGNGRFVAVGRNGAIVPSP